MKKEYHYILVCKYGVRMEHVVKCSIDLVNDFVYEMIDAGLIVKKASRDFYWGVSRYPEPYELSEFIDNENDLSNNAIVAFYNGEEPDEEYLENLAEQGLITLEEPELKTYKIYRLGKLVDTLEAETGLMAIWKHIREAEYYWVPLDSEFTAEEDEG